MITIILDAEQLKESYHPVRKPTGTNKFWVKKEIKIYHDKEGVKQVIKNEDNLFLVGEEGNITIINKDYKVAVDFQTIEESMEFLDELIRA